MKRLAAFVGLSILTLTITAHAQCPSWDPQFAPAGTDGDVHALVEFDDGSGPMLYAGGAFTTAGGESANRVARWNGQSWSPLADGVNGTVFALAVFDDGSGPALYAGGSFTAAGAVSASRVAKWDGGSWSALGNGTDDIVYALEVFDDGSGPALFAGGQFTLAGGASANHVAKWNGANWAPLGNGTNNTVRALEAFDDGSGAALFVGGRFSTAGPVSAARIARWHSGTWSALGSGIDDRVLALTVFDDGTGPALFVGGQFLNAGGASAANVAKWNGASFGALGTGTDARVHALHVFDSGSGPALYAGGAFATAGGAAADHVASWNGSIWSSTGIGADGDVDALAVFDSGAGAELIAGGGFENAQGARHDHVARWRGSPWRALGAGAPSDDIQDLVVFDDGTGPAIYACGSFTQIGGVNANLIAKWDGVGWSPLGSGITAVSVQPVVSSLVVHDDGSGPALYAAGEFETAGAVTALDVARWNGSSWSAVGNTIVGEGVHALIVYDDGTAPALYAGGYFGINGSTTMRNLARWNGASWSPVGGGVSSTFPLSTEVFSLETYDDGTGERLYVGGFFSSAGGVPVSHLAAWNGTSFSNPGNVSAPVMCMTVHDDGTGPSLYIGGQFTFAGGLPANNIARRNGAGWTALGSGLGVFPLELATFDDGAGPALYAGGIFPTAGGAPAERLAKWDGTAWSEVAGGVRPGAVAALLVFNDGTDGVADLYVGGSFDEADSQASDRLALLRSCPSTGPGFSFCSPGTAGVVNCPCVPPNVVPNPQAAPGHGCANSLDLAGALLTATGATSPDTVAFSAQVSPNYLGFALMLKGNGNAPGGVSAADGVRCVSGQLIRFGAHFAGTYGAPQGYWTYPNTVQTNPVSVQTQQPPGEFAYYQLFYRNAAPNFCTDATTNWSNGFRILWL